MNKEELKNCSVNEEKINECKEECSLGSSSSECGCFSIENSPCQCARVVHSKAELNEKEFKELEELAKPLVEYLCKKHDPHTSIIISYDHAKIVQDLRGVPYPVEG